MAPRLTEADRRFLAAVAEDAQRRLVGVALVESITANLGDEGGIALVIVVRAGRVLTPLPAIS